MPRQELSESYLSQARWIANGDKVFGHPEHSNGYTYNGIITTQADAGDYAVTARSNTSVEALAAAKKIIFYIPQGWVSLEFRYRTDGSEDDDSVVQVFAAAGKDHYRHVDQHTIIQGTQLYSTGIYFNDTITSAGETWITATSEPAPTNGIASYIMNCHKYDRLWIVANDLDTTSIYVDFKQL